MLEHQEEEQGTLILAAEECPQALFQKLHRFSKYENRIIGSLVAHGPVLLRGGRGSGKSALFIKSYNRLNESSTTAFSVYLSLRHLPLLRSNGAEYEQIFCELVIQSVNHALESKNIQNIDFYPLPSVAEVHRALVQLSIDLQRRIVLFFDDAAHLGRETSLAEFFDIFRTLSSSTISCKATIYPGLTQFGKRFDVYNDANVINISRNENFRNFAPFFLEVLEARYPTLLKKIGLKRDEKEIAAFLGRTVVGNMRAFIFLCNRLDESETVGFPEMTDSMIDMVSYYYWPLLEEIKPKIGIYEPLIEPCLKLANKLFDKANQTESTSIIIHRELVQKLAKLLEILEYAGFISRREVSRAMKSGGRGSRFTLNYCNLLEMKYGQQFTKELLNTWTKKEPAEIHIKSQLLDDIPLPTLTNEEKKELSILELPIDHLIQSKTYPYGLTQTKIDVLKDNKILTVRQLAGTPDDSLRSLEGIGEKMLARIHNVVGQAIWM